MKKRQQKKLECQYWSAKEYADIMGVHINTMYLMLKNGEVEGAVKACKSWRIRKRDV